MIFPLHGIGVYALMGLGNLYFLRGIAGIIISMGL